jgi:hypothetical protein
MGTPELSAVAAAQARAVEEHLRDHCGPADQRFDLSRPTVV